jgi:hypothetical protein
MEMERIIRGKSGLGLLGLIGYPDRTVYICHELFLTQLIHWLVLQSVPLSTITHHSTFEFSASQLRSLLFTLKLHSRPISPYILSKLGIQESGELTRPLFYHPAHSNVLARVGGECIFHINEPNSFFRREFWVSACYTRSKPEIHVILISAK